LEPFAIRLAVNNMTEEELLRLRSVHDQCCVAFEKSQFDDLMILGISFHRTIADTTHNPLLILILDLVENLLTDVKRVLRIDVDFSRRFIKCHESIIEALANRDANKAEKEMLNDVTVVEEELLRLAQHKSTINWT
jgi:DNA-binding GntR family transcriptional regulator